MKFQAVISIVFIFDVLLYSCKESKVEVIPLSPYEYVTSFTENDTTFVFTFAVKNFKYKDKDFEMLDTFVYDKIPKTYLNSKYGVLFIFYKYEKGKIDEKFLHKEQPKQANLFMEAGAESLVEYSWSHGKFTGVSVYKNGTYSKSESIKRNSNTNSDIKIKEVKID